MLAEAEAEIWDLYTMQSAFCWVGIVYLVICVIIIGARGFKGWGTVLTLWLIGCGISYIVCPQHGEGWDGWDCLQPRVFADDGTSIDLKELMSEPANDAGYFKDGKRYHFQPEIYSMNDPQSPHYLCSPKVFHIGCLFWTPLFALLGSAVVWFYRADRY